MKVLIAVLAFTFTFTFYADHCKADQTFPLNDGGYATVIDKTVDLVATGYLKESIGGDSKMFIVNDCHLGSGTVDIYRPTNTKGVFIQTFVNSMKWKKWGATTLSLIATHICDRAINKSVS